MALFCACLPVLPFTGCGEVVDASRPDPDCPEGASCAVYEETSVIIEPDPLPPEPTPPGYTVHLQYLLDSGDTPPQSVEEALSHMAIDDLDMAVRLYPVTPGIWQSKLTQLLQSGTPIDLFQSDPLFPWGASAETGSSWEDCCLDWADYLGALPDVQAALGNRLNAGYTGGFLAGLPLLGEEGGFPAMVFRKDVLQEVGIDPASVSLSAADPEGYWQLENVCTTASLSPGLFLSLAGDLRDGFFDPMGDGLTGILLDGSGSSEIIAWLETDLCRVLCELAGEWNGLHHLTGSPDAAFNTNEDEVRSGKRSAYSAWVYPGYLDEAETRTGRDLCTIPLNDAYRKSTPRLYYSLSPLSENPEKAAEFYNWLFTNGEAKDLLCWGKPGVNWTTGPCGRVKLPDTPSTSDNAYYSNPSFLPPNRFSGTLFAGAQQQAEYEATLEGTPLSPAYGFVFDPSPVAGQLKVCAGIYSRNARAIFTGDLALLEATIAELRENGLGDIIAEKQKQFDSWLAET